LVGSQTESGLTLLDAESFHFLLLRVAGLQGKGRSFGMRRRQCGQWNIVQMYSVHKQLCPLDRQTTGQSLI
jgi:hypothetical protein